MAEPCLNCGAQMRWETSHERCGSCGYIRPCCEGAPLPACKVPTTREQGESVDASGGEEG